MNGPQHYAEAERLLAGAMLDDLTVEDGYLGEIAAAQVHATLALTAATVRTGTSGDWLRVTAPPPVVSNAVLS